MEIVHACAFTGHRPAHFAFGNDELHPDCIRIKQALLRHSSALIAKGVTRFYTGMAMGVDTWAAETIIALKDANPRLELYAAIPCPQQADRWSAESQARYRRILASCDEQIVISRCYTPSCMHERNQFMVINSQHLIAVYDGSARGGTAKTVLFAMREGKDVIVIDV